MSNPTITVVCHEGGVEIHKAGCKDLSRWAKRPYLLSDYDDPSFEAVAWDVYGDQIYDESMTIDGAIQWLKGEAVKPCANGLLVG